MQRKERKPCRCIISVLYTNSMSAAFTSLCCAAWSRFELRQGQRAASTRGGKTRGPCHSAGMGLVCLSCLPHPPPGAEHRAEAPWAGSKDELFLGRSTQTRPLWHVAGFHCIPLRTFTWPFFLSCYSFALNSSSSSPWWRLRGQSFYLWCHIKTNTLSSCVVARNIRIEFHWIWELLFIHPKQSTTFVWRNTFFCLTHAWLFFNGIPTASFSLKRKKGQ